jgi:hypothetical protein
LEPLLEWRCHEVLACFKVYRLCSAQFLLIVLLLRSLAPFAG